MLRSPRRRWPLVLASLFVWGCRGDSALPLTPSEPATSGPRSNTANVAPTALFTVSPRWPRPGDTVTVDASYSLDRDGSVVHYEWDLGNGATQVAGTQAKTVYASAGSYPLSVTVVDDSGSRSTRTLSLVVSPAGAPATAVDSAQSLVVAANTSLLAAATTVVTVTARTALGLPVPNVPVWLSGRGREWRVTQPSALTTTLGVTTGAIGSPLTQSAQIVAIADYTLLRPVNVSIEATTLSLARSSLRLTDPVVSAPGDSTLLEVTARDAEGNPLVGATVSVAVTGGTSTVRNEGATDANGRRVVVIEPTTCGGALLTVTASVSGTPLPSTASVTAA
ncbi:PKD domain-containing protein, partial [Gemmatimonas sp.]|uniref:PKD domain-containing protein n=1 Tax=Gemmatimonas sp. TaxID=1962908 RepID=UPI0037C09DE1